MLSKAAVSELLGYCSIVAWLGAQFPQLIQNAKLKSVEHLALPFLANWLLGDITNLIGCLLTHQLPFQTYVATYFCSVDVCLVAQYIYYSQPRFKRLPPPSYSPVILPSQLSSPIDTASVLPRAYARSRAHSDLSDRRTALRSTSAVSYAANDIPQLRQISLTASQIAATAAAELNARLSVAPQQGLSDDLECFVPGHVTDDVGAESEEGDAVGRLVTASLLSNGQHHGNKRNISWGTDRGTDFRHRSYSPSQSTTDSPLVSHHGTMRSRAITSQLSEDNETQRGRPRTRPILDWEGSPTALTPTRTALSPASGELLGSAQTEPPRGGFLRRLTSFLPRTRKRSVGASKRGVSIVFFGLFFLAGSFRNGKPVPVVGPQGKVISAPMLDHSELSTLPAFPLSANWGVTSEYHDRSVLDDHHESRNREYIIGRVSAWACTTLYLTSRLPQIWKNFARKSVEGLTISLFVCAFLGNSFYVVSIMTSPRLDEPASAAKAFLRESVPYLLGSGGTLLFDIIIVAQSFIYAGRPPLPPSPTSGFVGPIRPRSRSSSKMVIYAGDIEYLASTLSATERDPLLFRTRTRSESMATHRGASKFGSVDSSRGMYGNRGSAIQVGRSMSRTPGIEPARRTSVSPDVRRSMSRPAVFNEAKSSRE